MSCGPLAFLALVKTGGRPAKNKKGNAVAPGCHSDRHGSRVLRAGFGLRLPGRQAAPAAAGRISRCRHPHRTLHAGRRRRRRAGQPARRNGRDPSDVRRRTAFLRLRPVGGARYRHSRSARPHRPGDAARNGTCLLIGLGSGRRHRVRPQPFGSQHGGDAQGAGGISSAEHAERPGDDRLADRRGSGHGAGAGAVAGIGGIAWRRRNAGRRRRRQPPWRSS